MRANEFINEEINPDIMDERFTHKQKIGDYLYVASWERFRYAQNKNFFTISVFDGPIRIGYVRFDVIDNTLVSNMTRVDDDYQKQGIASTMYAYAKMLGNDIKPSKYQLPDGRRMWKAWEKSGEAEHLMKED